MATQLILERLVSDSVSSVGVLFADHDFLCATLEDPHQWNKIHGKTRIPMGRYQLGLQTELQMTERYKLKYPNSHIGMIHILDVPGFTNCYFHIGNRHTHTDGCVLVGYRPQLAPDGEYEMFESAPAYEHFYHRVAAYGANGNAELRIIDRDR